MSAVARNTQYVPTRELGVYDFFFALSTWISYSRIAKGIITVFCIRHPPLIRITHRGIY
jgi:hypothetical protein